MAFFHLLSGPFNDFLCLSYTKLIRPTSLKYMLRDFTLHPIIDKGYLFAAETRISRSLSEKTCLLEN